VGGSLAVSASVGERRLVHDSRFVDGDKTGMPCHMETAMARTARPVRRQRNEEIDVREFQGIGIRFPGDVYILATWMAMSDMAKSSPAGESHTTLHGLARGLVMLHGADYANPLDVEDVMAVFRRHGIAGNPTLRLETTREDGTPLPVEFPAAAIHVVERLAAPGTYEQSHAPEPAAGPDADGEPSPPAP
jgi:hypothetical protein